MHKLISAAVFALLLLSSRGHAAETSATGKAIFDLTRGKVRLNSGYEMPIVGLGTYALGSDCEAAVTALLNAGGRLIDTASFYGTEAAVGRAVRTVPCRARRFSSSPSSTPTSSLTLKAP